MKKLKYLLFCLTILLGCATDDDPIDIEPVTIIDSWEHKADGNIAKNGISFTYKGEIYAGLGNDKFHTIAKIRKYNPEQNIWSDFATAPVGLSGALSFVIEDVNINDTISDYLYFGGGYNSIEQDEIETRSWRYNLTLNNGVFEEFTLGSQVPSITLPKANTISFARDGMGYLGLGGIVESGTLLSYFIGFEPSHNDVNYPQGHWLAMSAFPDSARKGATSIIIENSVLVVGGETKGGHFPKRVWEYIPDRRIGKWVQLNDFPGNGRTEAIGFSIGNKGYFGTGVDQDFWVYDSEHDTWQQINNFLGSPRSEAIAGSLTLASGEVRGYVAFGSTDTTGISSSAYFNDFWMYTP